MDLCVVITGFNDEGTILESIESVLSQTDYPRQIGFAHGPSRDSTDEFAGFYREEFDFIHWDSRINAAECGLMHLRLGSLSEVETSHVLFVRASSYLYRDALERAVDAAGESDLVLAPVRFMAPEAEDWNWEVPGTLEDAALLNTGPLPPSAVIWKTSALKSVFSRLQSMTLGSFGSLGWLAALREEDPTIARLEEPLVETWDFREGPHGWSRSVYTALARFLDTIGNVGGFRNEVRRLVDDSELPGDHPFFEGSNPENPEAVDDGQAVPAWVSDRYPMVE